MTTSERNARINREFERSFGVFDNHMRTEQATIAGQRGGRGGSGGRQGNSGEAGAAAGSSSEGAGESDQPGSGGQAGSGDKSAQGNGQNSGQGQSGRNGQGGNGQTGGGGYGGGPQGGGGPATAPADIPDGSDDDVVARQLREAATAETDPELREKLWQEYRNYKKSAG